MTTLSQSAARTYLNSLVFVPPPAQVGQLMQSGLTAWLTQQLNAPAGDDAATKALLAATLIPLDYTDANGVVHSSSLPLQYLNATSAQLMALAGPSFVFAQQVRPGTEIRAATWIRAASNSAQLRELMARFWNNHFSVDYTTPAGVGMMLPLLDQQVIRPNVFGNFRTMLGAVAKSGSMMYYLDLSDSNKTDPNENYAREVMELHTLGAIAYLGIGTPGAVETGAGYTDQDVIQVARVLTGWTIANGHHKNAAGAEPADGSFLYAPSIHDTGTKSVLGVTFPNSAGPGQAEGEAFLDLLAAHPSTAIFVSGKLVRWLAGDTPTQALYSKAQQVWSANIHNPNQIAQVILAIVQHPDFLATPVSKVKDPFRFMVSLLRATGASWSWTTQLQGLRDNAGYPLFSWATPDGIPDRSSFWTSTDGMLTRWLAANSLLTGPTITSSLVAASGDTTGKPAPQIAFWTGQLLGGAISSTSSAALQTLVADPALWGSHATLSGTALETATRRLIGGIAQLPEFQTM
jgi:uncharacterized protein (DUF1800 family)